MTRFCVEAEGAHAVVEYVDSSGSEQQKRLKPGWEEPDEVVVDGPPRVRSDGPVSVRIDVLEDVDDEE
jgi:hypothetical protein